LNRNRCISWLLTLALMAGLFSPLSTLAPEAQAAGSLKPTAPVLDDFLVPVSQVTKVPAGYTGIYTASDLLAISDAPNDNYILMADIDLSGYQWKPLCSTYPFTGIFEGNGHVITGLNGCGGLFDSVKDGTVRNVGVENATIYPDITVYNLSPIGGIVGELRSSLGLPVVSNCYFSGNIHDLQPPAFVSLSSCTMGGIVGQGLNGNLTVEYCWMKGDIVSDYLSSIIGGIVGISDTLTINGCIHMGNIRAVTQKKASIGGICGNGYGELIDCQNWGSITYQGPEANVAGIINCSASPGPDLTRCMNAADISVTDTTKGSDNSRASKVGGLLSNSEGLYDCFNCGDIFADGCCKVGGLAGEGPRLARNCYNTGRITALNMGRDYDGTSKFASLGGWPWDLENCFGLVRPGDTVPLLPENYVEDYLVNVRGLSESQMGSSSSFSGFDFDSVWTMGSGSYPYPVLQSMNLPDSGSGGGSTTQPSSGTIPTPVLDKAEFANKAVTVTWTLPLTVPGQTHTVDSFNILRKSGSGSSYQKIATVSGSSGGSYTDRAVIIGATYTYTVQACYQGKTGSYNAEGLTVKAEDPPGVSDDLSYEIVNGKAVITDCRETAVNVVIPAQLEGCPVVMIGTGAFQDCKKLTSVTLPDCLTVVGDHAFNGCSSLTSIDLTHVISIGQQAFAWCTELTDIRCGPDLQAIGEYALRGFNSKLVVTGYVRTPAELQCSMEGVRFRYIPANVDNTVRGTFEYSNANGDPASYSFYYSDDFFSYDNSAYHSDLAIMTLKLAMAGYSRQNLYTEELPEHDLRRALNLQRLFSDIGFGNAEFHNYNTALTDYSSKVAYGFASRQIGQDVVVAVVLRGGGYGAEWADNFNVGTSGDHAGFSAAAKAVQAELEDYIAGLKDLYQFSGDVKLWMTGYSRSGATCNLLAQAMSSKIDSDNLYAYVFAAPNCTTSPKACRGLFSIISAADVVPCVPLSKWGFGRHGTTLTFPSTLPASRKDEFEKLSGIDLDDHKPVTYTIQPAAIQRFIFSLGMVVGSRSAYNDRYSDLIQQSLRAYYGTEEPLYSAEEAMANGLSISVLLPLLPDNLISLYMLDAIGRAHEPAHYLAWLEAGTLNSIRDFDASGKMVTFASSANAQIRSSSGDVVATIRGGVISTVKKADGLQLECADGQTTVLLTSGDWTVEVYGSGTADITVLELDANSALCREVLFSGVALKDLTIALDVDADADGQQYVLEDGDTIIKPTSDVTNGEAASSGAFRDVPAGGWYYDAVQWAVENGVTSGTGPDTFSPDRACTRSEVVTLLWRALGLDEVSASSAENPFRDVPTGAFYHDAVLWAAENGITTGSTPTTFSPNAVCTRSEVVTFLWRADFPLKQLSGSMAFTDVDRGDFFWYPVKWAVEEDITTGTSATTFSPMLTCTRAQVVTFLYRFFSR
jgi:hypothetical protein